MAESSPSSPAENPYQSPLPAMPVHSFRDRKGLIRTMGVLLILGGAGFGCLGGLYGLAMPAFLGRAPEETRSAMPFDSGWMSSMMGMLGLMMVTVAVALVWLGVGAARLRRWAGDLLLAGGWLSGMISLVSVVGMAVTMPQTMTQAVAEIQRSQEGGSAEAARVVEITMFVSMGLMMAFYLIPPLALILVFRLKSVKQTLRHYDQRTSWTDGLALPVLIWWVWLASMVVCMLAMAPASGPIYQAMGLVQEAWQAMVAMVALSLIAGVCAWAVMTRKPWSWYVSMALAVLCGVTGWFTLSKMDLMELYRKMGMKEEQLQSSAAFYGNGAMYQWLGMITMVTMIVFLLATKRFYRFDNAPESAR